MSRRLRLDIAYDGSDYSGWAKQPGLRTVQGEVEDVLAMIFRTPCQLTVAGRTDKGVHALGQVAHVDVPAEAFERLGRTGIERLANRMNKILTSKSPDGKPAQTVIKGISAVSDDFDARFSATYRRYIYRIAPTASSWIPTRTDLWRLGAALDLAAMGQAAAGLLGEHDFLSFCKPREGATTIRTLRNIYINQVGRIVEIELVADAFCHSMVRSIVGALVAVGTGKHGPDWPAVRLAEKCRGSEPQLAPAAGLTLEEVGYPDEGEWAVQSLRTRRVRSLD